MPYQRPKEEEEIDVKVIDLTYTFQVESQRGKCREFLISYLERLRALCFLTRLPLAPRAPPPPRRLR